MQVNGNVYQIHIGNNDIIIQLYKSKVYSLYR